MAATLITATLQNNNGLAKDAVRFSWATSRGGLTAADVQLWFDQFFNITYAGAANANCEALASCMNPSTIDPGAELRAYDISAHLDGSPHGSPYVITNWKLLGVGGDSRGNQLAAVIGYQAADYLTTPVEGPTGAIKTQGPLAVRTALPTHTGVTKLQSRKSGRMYFGPLDGSVIGVNGDANPELTGTWRTNFPINVEGFLDTNPDWSVWSRRNASLTPITHGWVDASIESRRKRAFTGAGRNSWSQAGFSAGALQEYSTDIRQPRRRDVDVTVWSKQLASYHIVTNDFAEIAVYTVPAGKVAIAKRWWLVLHTGQFVQLGYRVNMQDGSRSMDIAQPDNTAGSASLYWTLDTWDVLPAGATIFIKPGGTATNSKLIVSGYELSLP